MQSEKRKPGDGRTKPSVTQRQISDTDPQGSYTGVPVHPEETPVQDADDL